MIREATPELLSDPLRFASVLWPKVKFYDKQAEVIRSVDEDDVTVVPAGNMLGKDFVAGAVALWFFLSRSPCRVVTTSAKDDHLRVLWGEIGRFFQDSAVPLDHRSGGPLIFNHHDIRRVKSDGTRCPISYIKGMVASQDSIAAMQGHHVANMGDGVPRTLFIADEASSVPDEYWQMATTWCNRALIIGNTWPCVNFFKRMVDGYPGTDDMGGNLFSEDEARCYRRVIRITAEDSPNVRLARAEIAAGREPSGRIVIPGVKSWQEYQKNLATWDKVQQSVSLNAQFFKGSELMMFPEDWLFQAHRNAADKRRRGEKYMGIDPGEGGDSTVWTVIDECGIIAQVSLKTPDTAEIVGRTVAMIREHNVRPENVLFDRGGGGKQHADRMRQMGIKVRTVGFGEAASDPDMYKRMRTSMHKTEASEIRYAFKNRRAEMFFLLRELIDPAEGHNFGIPKEMTELVRQLKPIPLMYDGEGRIVLPPKDKPSRESRVATLKEMLGCSPDEADSTVLAVFGMQRKAQRFKAGAF